MNEKRQLAILLLAVLVIGSAGVLLAAAPTRLGDVYVDQYRADLYLNGTLHETYQYKIEASGTYRMLYRVWDAPLAGATIGEPSVEPVSIHPPPGTIPYTKDYQGDVKLLAAAPPASASEIRDLALQNEAGCYYPDRFEAGEYTIDYVFRLE